MACNKKATKDLVATTDAIPDFPCPTCNQNVPENVRAIGCDCGKWYHFKCTELNEKQFKALISNDGPMTWVCKECWNLKARKKGYTGSSTHTPGPEHNNNTTNNSKQENQEPNLGLQSLNYEKIIEVLKNDLNDLKTQLKSTKEENIKLSDTIARKMQVISDMEQTIYDFAIPSAQTPTQQTTTDMTAPTTLEKSQANQMKTTTPMKTVLTRNKNKPETPEEKILIISDSILRYTAQILQNEKKLNTTCNIIPGGRIQDCSRLLSSLKTLPKTILINFGSNNVQTARTPNHVMRPIWLTIETMQKKFPDRIWYVNSILYRRDIRDKYIHDVNEALKFMCSQLKIKYIDTNGAVEDDNYGYDGIHLNKQGACKLADLIEKELLGFCQTQDQHENINTKHQRKEENLGHNRETKPEQGINEESCKIGDVALSQDPTVMPPATDQIACTTSTVMHNENTE